MSKLQELVIVWKYLDAMKKGLDHNNYTDFVRLSHIIEAVESCIKEEQKKETNDTELIEIKIKGLWCVV